MPDDAPTCDPSPDELLVELQASEARLKALLPKLDTARQAYFVASTPESLAQAERVQDEATTLLRQIEAATEGLARRLGLGPEDGELTNPAWDPEDRMARANLTQDRIDPTADIDALLPAALDKLLPLLPKDWLGADTTPVGLEPWIEPEAILSLTKGMRPESEAGPVHRFRQAILLAQAYLEQSPAYDHFAGASLVPTIVQLGSQLEHLSAVGGDVAARVSKLHAGPSVEVDSTVFELLTAARCAAMGRAVEFITETSARKTPDLKCHDPYPMVIECKRQRSFVNYELAEDQEMRALFQRLRQEARRLGVFGAFELRLEVEASCLPIDDVVAGLVGQRLAPDPRRATRYPFGTVALTPAPERMVLGRSHRLYSPDMLEALFGWSADLPTWDGLVCSVKSPELQTDTVREPIGLLWTNESEAALNKRTWTAASLFGSAMSQVPKGGFGMVYVAYTEGGRESVADRRLERFISSLSGWTHDANIRLPMVNINRLYPRPLGDGRPDLIESSVRFLGGYATPEAFALFPATVFTRQDME